MDEPVLRQRRITGFAIFLTRPQAQIECGPAEGLLAGDTRRAYPGVVDVEDYAGHTLGKRHAVARCIEQEMKARLAFTYMVQQEEEQCDNDE